MLQYIHVTIIMQSDCPKLLYFLSIAISHAQYMKHHSEARIELYGKFLILWYAIY